MVILHESVDSRIGESPPHPRGVSYSTPIEAAKEAVTVLELAERLVGSALVRKGNTYTARCPLPDHDEKTPSFTVYADNGRGWACFGCRRGGDVVHLYAHAEGVADMRVAAAELLMAFGHEVPERPPSWFARQERQGPVRDAIDRMRVRRLQNVLYGMVEPFVTGEQDARRTWAECWPVALSWYERIQAEREGVHDG